MEFHNRLTPPGARILLQNLTRIADALERGEQLTSSHLMVMRQVAEAVERLGLDDGRLDYLQPFRQRYPRQINLAALREFVRRMEAGEIELDSAATATDDDSQGSGSGSRIDFLDLDAQHVRPNGDADGVDREQSSKDTTLFLASARRVFALAKPDNDDGKSKDDDRPPWLD